MIKPQNYITIGENQVGLYFGYPCFNDYTVACLGEAKYASLQDGAGVAKLFQTAHENFCLIREIKPALKYEDFYMWVEDKINSDEKNEIETLLNIWAECTSTKKSLERIAQITEEDEKKNLKAV
jgi:hypothetical protein